MRAHSGVELLHPLTGPAPSRVTQTLAESALPTEATEPQLSWLVFAYTLDNREVSEDSVRRLARAVLGSLVCLELQVNRTRPGASVPALWTQALARSIGPGREHWTRALVQKVRAHSLALKILDGAVAFLDCDIALFQPNSIDRLVGLCRRDGLDVCFGSEIGHARDGQPPGEEINSGLMIIPQVSDALRRLLDAVATSFSGLVAQIEQRPPSRLQRMFELQLPYGDQTVYNRLLSNLSRTCSSDRRGKVAHTCRTADLKWGIFPEALVGFGCTAVPNLDRQGTLASHATQVRTVNGKLSCLRAMHSWMENGTIPHCAYAWRTSPAWQRSRHCRAACPPRTLATNCVSARPFTHALHTPSARPRNSTARTNEHAPSAFPCRRAELKDNASAGTRPSVSGPTSGRSTRPRAR